MASDNILVSNKGLHPTINFRFMLRVWGIFDVPCRSIRAFTKPNEYEFIQEGGLNDYVHIRRKPISQPFKLVVERYAGTDYIDPLPNGAELVLPVLLFIWNDRGSLASMFSFSGCVVMEKEYGELSAEKAGLFTETITIGYTTLTPINIPDGLNDSGGKEPWDFKTDGNKTKWANTRSVYHADKWDAKDLAAKWEPDDGTENVRAMSAAVLNYTAKNKKDPKLQIKWDPKNGTKNARAMNTGYYKDYKAVKKDPKLQIKWDAKSDGTKNKRAMNTKEIYTDYKAVVADAKLTAKWDSKDGKKNKRAMSTGMFDYTAKTKDVKLAEKWKYQSGVSPQKNVRALSREIHHGGGWQKSENAAKWDPKNGTKNERAMSTGIFDYTAVETDPKLKAKWEYQSGVSPQKNVRALSREIYHGAGWQQAENAAKWDSKNGTQNKRAMSTGMFDYTAKTKDVKLAEKWKYQSGVSPQKNVRALSREVYHGGGWSAAENAAKWDSKNGTKNERAMSTGMFDYTAKTNDPKLKEKWEYKSGKIPPENKRALTRKVDYGKKGGKAVSSIQAPLDHGNNNAVKTPRAQSRQVFHGNGWQAASFQGVWKYDKGNPSKGYRGMSAAFLSGN